MADLHVVDGNTDETLQIAQHDFSKLKSSHFKAGYREGVSAGKEASLQSGFNDGFKNGVDCTLQWAVLKGKASALRAYCETRSLPPSVVEEAAQVLRGVEGAEECVKQTLGQWAGQYREQKVQESVMSAPVAGKDPSSRGGASVVDQRLQELERRLEVAKSLVRSHKSA